MKYRGPILAVAVALVLLRGLSAAQPPGAQMPDPKQMSGVPLPTSEIPAGMVTVRVVRGTLSNLVVGQRVELAGDVSATATTNDAGRAEFTGLTPGARVTAIAVVDGERLESQAFTLPPQAGIRLMLVATDPAGATRADEGRTRADEPARTGIVILGEQTRFIVELGDEGLTVFNVCQFVNTAGTPVEPAVPIAFTLPDVAERPSLLEGSSPLAVLAGDRVNVNGPFPPGPTLVQFAYTIPYASESVTITQRLPAALAQVALVVQKAGEMRLSSPQVTQQRDITAEGQTYMLGQGPPLAAGNDITLTISGLPHVSAWPRNLALGLAVLILAAGVYGVLRGGGAGVGSTERLRLETQRERLFTELIDLDAAHRQGSVDPQRYAARRRELIATLERVYAALDETVAA